MEISQQLNFLKTVHFMSNHHLAIQMLPCVKQRHLLAIGEKFCTYIPGQRYVNQHLVYMFDANVFV